MKKINTSEYQKLSTTDKSKYTRFSGQDEVYYEEIPIVKKDMSNIIIEQSIVELWEADTNIGDIAKKLNIGLYEVTRCLSKLGYTIKLTF